MTKKQIYKFIKKINYNIPIRIIYIKNVNIEFIARAKYINQVKPYIKKNKHLIIINVELLNESDFFIKDTLLHEVGHFYNDQTKQSMREYYAQLWSIKRSKELKMFKIMRYSINEIMNWEFYNYPKIYKMASKYFKNNWR